MSRHKSSWSLLLKLAVVGVFSLVTFVGSNTLLAQEPPSGTQVPSSYPTSDIDEAVWNEGQAAFWDLNVADHFRLFGFAEKAKGYSPEQPIKFSHVIHVAKNKMECQYCHYTVSKAAFAAIPEVSTCMGCHKLIKTESPEIQKLTDYYNKGEPVPWVKVHVTPDHVNFNHKRHVKAGVACNSCHGEIPQMEQVERMSSMKMGWCVSCHREKGASIDCWTCHK